jgi:hypothetical protein
VPDDDDKPLEPQGAADAIGAEGGGRNFVADAVRKAVLTGLGAVFLTEEGARKLAREWKLPKEIVGYVTSQAAGARDEVLRVVTEEVRKFFESEALRRELVRLVSSMSIEVHAEIRLRPGKKGKLESDVKLGAVKPRFGHKAADEDPEGE